MSGVRYYHGGPPGLKGEILPPDRTGAKSLASYGAGHVCRTDRVYLTTLPDAALIFATGASTEAGPGWVYEVAPFGDIELDPDYNGPAGQSVCCSRARILRVHHRLTIGEARRLARELGLI